MRLYRHSAWSAIKSKTARIVKLVGVLGVGSVLWLSPPLARGEDPPSSPPPTEELPPVQVQMLSPDMKGSQQQEAPPLPPQPPQPAQAPPPPAAPPPAPTPSGSVSPSPKPEELPDIQARYYPVSVVRHSSSDKVYLLADTSDAKPRPGRILLLRKPDSPTDPAYQIMAFRILRTYPEKKQFAAKVVKKYGDNRVLSDNSTYSAIEKLSDYTPPTPTPQDKADLKELESKPAPAPSTAPPATAPSPLPPEPAASPAPAPVPEASPSPVASAPAEAAPPGEKVAAASPPPPAAAGYDPELDAGSSPPPPTGAEAPNSDDNHLGLTVEEIQPLETRRSWLTAELGFFQNLNIDPDAITKNNGQPPAGYYAGGGARYGFSVFRQILLRKASVQDSITPEAGIFAYKILGANNDTYTLLPVLATIRYNILFGEKVAIFIYGGIMQNFVVAATQASLLPDGKTATTDALRTTIPAFGGGLLLRLGPSWNIRLDAGWDSFSLGLVLRF